jgi:hypothetical protein
MTLVLENLDDETRGFMLTELDEDQLAGRIYLSDRLTPDGARRYPILLRQAIGQGGTSSFENALADPGTFRTMHTYVRRGQLVNAKMPANAPQMLAEGEFNRYYIRGVCGRVIAEGSAQVQVYRARSSYRPRPGSDAEIGMLVDAVALLDDLRTCIGMEPSILPEVNSGLSVRIP